MESWWALDCTGAAPSVLLRALHRLPGVEVLLRSRHLHGESFYLYLTNFTYPNHFILFQLDKKEGFPKRLDRELRKLEADHNKKLALVNELGALPGLAEPG